MKARSILFALGALLTGNAFAASPFSIYFNTEGTSSCSVSNVTNINVLPDGNILATTNGTPVVVNPGACGVVSTPTDVTFTTPLTPSSYLFPSSSGGAKTLTFAVSNASGACTTTGSTAGVTLTVTNNSSVSGTFPPNASTTTDATYTVKVNCTGTNSSTASSTATVTVPMSGSTTVPTNCTQGTPSDVSGYMAQCSGTYTFHTGGMDSSRGPAPYSFKFVFGNNTNDWPGGPFGTTEIFSMGTTQYLSIPFKPTPGHTITVNEAQSFTAHPISMSISTSPGLFNNVQKGNGVICVKSGGQPSLIVSSNGTTSNCALDQNTVYWLNIIPAYYSLGQWKTDFTGSSKFGITIYQQN